MVCLKQQLKHNPCIAILRGAQVYNVIDVAQLLYEQGVRVIEVPVNRENAIDCIVKLKREMPNDCLIGAGTVTTLEQLQKLDTLGVNFIVSPNMCQGIIKEAINKKMIIVPGVASATEAFSAVKAGARFLKLFPATTYGINHLKALLAVLPCDVSIIPVGGVNADNINQWLEGGAIGVGLGSDLYQSGDDIEQTMKKMAMITNALL